MVDFILSFLINLAINVPVLINIQTADQFLEVGFI